MSIVRAKAHALIGVSLIADAVDVLRQPSVHEQVVAPLTAKVTALTSQNISPKVVVRASAISQAVSGGLIAVSVLPRFGAFVSLLTAVPATFLGYRFWQIKDDAALRASRRQGFFAHLTLVGALLLIVVAPRRKAKTSTKASATKATKTVSA
ncbi:MAG: hypothetical protein LBJ62_08175 [Bifidobacteriaceae bacterium]|jgi:uncharacterized membrane protein YphA (DoxX/SURF4 family)|nr:hypothetical protein [Bifidobacteriaceae bacterium]